MAITSANQLELLQTAEAVAREKMIDPSLVIKQWKKVWLAQQNLDMEQSLISELKLIEKLGEQLLPELGQ